MKHETILVEYGDFSAQTDVEIAPLVLEILKAGIKISWTFREEHDISIAFSTCSDAIKFLSIVAKYDDNNPPLYWKVIHSDITGGYEWRYFVRLFDRSLSESWEDSKYGVSYDIEHHGDVDFYFEVNFRIPFIHIPIIEQLMIDHNA